MRRAVVHGPSFTGDDTCAAVHKLSRQYKVPSSLPYLHHILH